MHYIFRRTSRFILVIFIVVCVVFVIQPGFTSAATLQLGWVDNSPDEDGFSIERKVGTNGVYSVIATVGANVTTYADINLADGTTYCYRVNAFNSAGYSPYSPEACGTTPSPPAPSPTTPQFTLTINLIKQITTNGTGDGTVTSSPAGINCGAACSAAYNAGTVVTLTATPAVGSTFAGWSGSGCTSGSITVNANTICTATFSPQATQTFTLGVSKVGTGTGIVTSNPAGINCGATCSAAYNADTVVTLMAVPAAGSTFAGWSGTGCASGSITMTSSTTCTADFQIATTSLATKIGVFRPSTGEWFLDRSGNGQWDGCDVDNCIASFGQPDDLPVVGSWSGNGASHIGTFNPTTGSWRLDTNENGVWDGCAVDTCLNAFGQPGDLPPTRELSGLSGRAMGTFTPRHKAVVRGRKVVKRGLSNFHLKAPNTPNGCSAEECEPFGAGDTLPVVGDWTGTGQEEIGDFRPNGEEWFLDMNGNGRFDGCNVDACPRFGASTDLPVVGDWDGTGKVRIGVFRPSTGEWFLDMNGNAKFDGCNVDACPGFGASTDLPVVGDWDGTGKVRIGVFRPSTGEWFLDMNGNGKFDGCKVDACLGPFGQTGDLPAVGKW